MSRVVALVIATVLAVLVGTGTAQAHSELIGSTPAADAVLDTGPGAVELVFNQQIQDQFTTVTVTGQDGSRIAAAAPSVQGERVLLALSGELSSGRYIVGYRVISEDGHPITGSFGFAVSSAGPAHAADAPTTSAVAAPPTVTTSTGQEVSGSGSSLILPVLGVVVAIALVGGVVIVMRSSRQDS